MAQLFALTGLVLLAFHARLIVRNLVGDPAVVSMVHLFTLGTITMAMMAGPMYVLYEVGIWIIALLEKSWRAVPPAY
jgi:hypothetical protein